jgi:CheY-like chemotaxis protein/HPt (histidine-containing phosphotransfer) domain-containing protein
MFTVRDTGIGMDKKASERLFKPFAQADASVTRNYGGTGLGLVISKRLIDLMGGEIGVKSQEGRGSAFWFTVSLKKSMGDISSRQKDLRGSRVLMISRNEDYLKSCKVFFSSWGLQQDLTNDIREGVGKIKIATSKGPSLRYDVIILDETTLAGNAAKLTLKLRSDKRLGETAVLLLTESGKLPESLLKLEDVGACAAGSSEAILNQAIEKLFAGESDTAVSEEEIDRSSSYMAAPEEEAAEGLGGHLLLVEDNPVNMHVAQKILSVIGMKVDVAENGKEALRLLHEHQYKAVLMDCMMPIMDGYTATREWRKYEAQHGHTRIPILAMTANAMAGDREKCLDSGMDDYMSKPLNRHLLEQMLRRWIKKGEEASQPKVSIASAPAKTGAQPPAPSGAVPAATAPAAVEPEASASSAKSDGIVLDKQILDDLIDIMGDEFRDLVQIYLEDSPKALAKLAEAAEKDDPKLLVGPAHSLKSTSANLGAIALSDLARDVEQDARLGKSEHATDRVKQMHQVYKQVVAALEKQVE